MKLKLSIVAWVVNVKLHIQVCFKYKISVVIENCHIIDFSDQITSSKKHCENCFNFIFCFIFQSSNSCVVENVFKVIRVFHVCISCIMYAQKHDNNQYGKLWWKFFLPFLYLQFTLDWRNNRNTDLWLSRYNKKYAMELQLLVHI